MDKEQGIMKTVGKEIEDVLGSVASNLKEIAQKHGAWIVLGLAVVYLWRKIK